MTGLDDEVVQEYLAECREHLNGIENDLLSMERDGAEIDDRIVNKVFRAAHSIKGGAGFFNFNKIRDLAHKTENVLELIRSRRTLPSPEVISVLLLAFDKLRELIENVAASEQAQIGEFVQALEALAASGLPPESKESITRKADISAAGKRTRARATEFDIDAARKSGKKIYLAEYDLLHDVQRNGKTPLEVLRFLMQYGVVLDTAFDLESAGTLEDEPSKAVRLDVLYATCLETDLIGSVVEIPLERIWRVDRGGACRSLADEMAPAAMAPVAAAAPLPPPPAPPPCQPAAVETSAPPAAASPHDSTVRLNVSLLDSLMNLAGELVLCRNQLSDAVARGDQAMIRAASQAISVVTSDVQQTVMRTRMQPVSALFQKFTRFVRDAGLRLGKQVRLVMEANEVELDKTIVEGLSDPLSHMVRNSVDHGIEEPSVRAARGKPSEGTVFLRAWHEAGLVVIEAADDGRGLDGDKLAAAASAKGLISPDAARSMTAEEKLELIFLPGFSTAERVSDLSGRGVGMDVVRTNLERLGGKLEIHSEPGLGASFQIKLPLTLAIIPSLLVSAGEERVAIPLVNVQKLIRIAPADVRARIQRVGNARVLLLKEAAVPLVDLGRALDVEAGPHGRDLLADAEAAGEALADALNIVLVGGGAFRYGLAVERLHDTMEIVVKPLSQRLKQLGEYAGATILGDGSVALILDVAGLAPAAGLAPENLSAHAADAPAGRAADAHRLLLFQNSPSEACALPLHFVSRVEKIRPEQVETAGGRRSMQYRGHSLPLMTLADAAQAEELALGPDLVVVVLELAGREVGLLASRPVDAIETRLDIDPFTMRQNGVMGSAIIRQRTTLILEPYELAQAALPGWNPGGAQTEPVATGASILVVEDSAFFREQTIRMVEGGGYAALAAADGHEAWELLDRAERPVALVVTDVEMPRLDGLELTRRIRADRRMAQLPVIMLTSLAGEEDVMRGQAAGATRYCAKLDSHRLVETIRDVLAGADAGAGPALAELSRKLCGSGLSPAVPAAPAAEGEPK